MFKESSYNRFMSTGTLHVLGSNTLPTLSAWHFERTIIWLFCCISRVIIRLPSCIVDPQGKKDLAVVDTGEYDDETGDVVDSEDETRKEQQELSSSDVDSDEERKR